MSKTSRTKKWLAAMALLAPIVLLACVLIGPTGLPPAKAASVLFGGAGDPVERAIVMRVRLPRVLFAALAGAALAVAGCVFQGILRNPLAEPYILGVSAGAGVGASIGFLLMMSASWLLPIIPFLAFAGAAAAMTAVYLLGRVRGNLPRYTLILAGVIVNAIGGAITMLIISRAGRHAEGIMRFLMGDLGSSEILGTAGRSFLALASALILGGIGLLILFARPLDLFAFGEETAQQLGVATHRMKKLLLLLASLVTGAAVSFSGLIGFVGLVVPHTMRFAVGARHRPLLPASALAGAAFLAVADTVARSLSGATAPGAVMSLSGLPVGTITALVGGPFFIYLLRRSRHGMGNE